MNISAETIAEIYKARWEVEVFFKWIKQNLNMKKVFGTSKNEVYDQLDSEWIVLVYNYLNIVRESIPSLWYFLVNQHY